MRAWAAPPISGPESSLEKHNESIESALRGTLPGQTGFDTLVVVAGLTNVTVVDRLWRPARDRFRSSWPRQCVPGAFQRQRWRLNAIAFAHPYRRWQLESGGGVYQDVGLNARG
jgi:hypothetical protein